MTIGQTGQRSGVVTSALRYWESEGLIVSERTTGNQRRFRRATLRRIALIRAAQSAGLTIPEIRTALATLREGTTPTKRDWQRLTRALRSGVERRIAELEALRDQIDDCIGCGCLTLENCGLLNPSDRIAASGPGPRFLLGDPKPDVT
jgi:MerR family redox-sensitive transcriptional activator SoxR